MQIFIMIHPQHLQTEMLYVEERLWDLRLRPVFDGIGYILGAHMRNLYLTDADFLFYPAAGINTGVFSLFFNPFPEQKHINFDRIAIKYYSSGLHNKNWVIISTERGRRRDVYLD